MFPSMKVPVWLRIWLSCAEWLRIDLDQKEVVPGNDESVDAKPWR
jgi:hypothetical protein